MMRATVPSAPYMSRVSTSAAVGLRVAARDTSADRVATKRPASSHPKAVPVFPGSLMSATCAPSPTPAYPICVAAPSG